MNEEIVCFYHSRDLDGWTSAAIVKRKFPEAKLVGWDYGDEITTIKLGVHIIMVDISFPMIEMENLAKWSRWNLTWIDHHKSAIKEYRDFIGKGESFCKAILNSDFAACELTWEYFFPEKPIPEAVRLLGRYDCFGHKGTSEEKKVLLFQYAARAICDNPETAEGFIDMDQDGIKNMLMEGRGIYDYLCMEARQAYKNGFKVDFDGYPFIVIPKERINPINFGINYHEDGYSGAACFWYKDHKWVWSLYNDDGSVDVSEICKKRGGGGHKGAAGFTSENFDVWNK